MACGPPLWREANNFRAQQRTGGPDCEGGDEVWNLLDAADLLRPRDPKQVLSFPCPLQLVVTGLGQGHGRPSVLPCASQLADASLVELLHRWGRLVGWALSCGLQDAVHLCDCDISIRTEDTCEVWTLPSRYAATPRNIRMLRLCPSVHASTRLGVVHLLQAAGNPPFSFVAPGSPVFTDLWRRSSWGYTSSPSYGIRDIAGHESALTGARRGKFQQERNFANRRPRGCQLIGRLRIGELLREDRCLGWLRITPSLFDTGRGSTQRPHV